MSKGAALTLCQASILGCGLAYAASSTWLFIACAFGGLLLAQRAKAGPIPESRFGQISWSDRVERQLETPFDKKA